MSTSEFSSGFASQDISVYALPHLYLQGLNVSVASTTVIALAPGQARDSNNVIDMAVGSDIDPCSPLFINSAVVGANGLDQGTLAASSNYTVWLIGDSRNYLPVAGLLSLFSNAFPMLPAGYDSFRLIGFVGTDGSTHFDSTTILNAAYEKCYYLQPVVSVLAAGASTTFATIDLSTPIPTTTSPFVIAILSATFIPAAVGNTAMIRPIGSTATTGLVTITGQEAAVPQVSCISVMTGVGASKPEIAYKVTSASDSLTLSVKGYCVTLA